MDKRSTTKYNLTAAQADVLQFIKDRCSQQGVPPSYREIQAHFGYKAIGTVQDHIKALLKKGALEAFAKTKGKRPARGLLPTGHRNPNIKQVPIYGEIAAGAAREAQQMELGELAVSDALSKNPSFALRVVGNSMIDVGIYEGDLLIVEKRSRIKNGDIVVARLDEETTVKRYVRKGADIYLVPENKTMKPIPVKGREFEIQGKVVGLERKM